MEQEIVSKPAFLGFWDEIVGVVRRVSMDEHFTYIEINDTLLAIDNGSREANELGGINSGERIAILRTDLPDNPLLIRRISEERKLACHQFKDKSM